MLEGSPNRVGAFIGTPAPKMGASGKFRQVPTPHVGCTAPGLVGSGSAPGGPPVEPPNARTTLSPPLPCEVLFPEPPWGPVVFPLPPVLPLPRDGPSLEEEQAKAQAIETKSPLNTRARGDAKYIQKPTYAELHRARHPEGGGAHDGQ